MEEANIQLPLIPHNCPLCNSMVKLYFINFDEKIVMCENTECDYPFGHEDIKFYKESGDAHSGEEVFSFRSPNTASVAPSTISASAWADIDHINKVYESEDNRPDLKSTKEPSAKKQKTQTEKENEEQLNKNVENIKQMTKALVDNRRNVQCINNEKWLKNLMSKQVCGMKLLRQGEITKLKKTELNFGTAELKIDINPSPDNLSSITIEIANYNGI